MAKRKMVCVLGLLLGCNGTETGNPIDNPEETAGGDCEEVESTKLELATPSALGFSASEVLAYAGGAHDETLTWQSLRFGSYGPESGAQKLALDVAPRGARLVSYRNRGGNELEQGCGTQLEIEADVTLKSAGGALDESVRATLVAKQRDVATLYEELDPKKLRGTLTVTPPSDLGPGWITAAIQLRTQFTPYGVSGSFFPSFEQHTKDAVAQSAGAGELATFGLPGCARGISVPREATGAASSASTFALLAEHGTASLNTTSATLSFEPGEVVCRHLGDAFSPYPEPSIAIPGKLVVKTADGAIDGRWPVDVQSKPDASGQLTGPVTVELVDQGPHKGSFADEYGFRGLDTSGYDSSSVTVMLSLSAAGWSGSVVVYGFKNADCPVVDAGANGSPGCSGAERSELARFELR